MRKEHKYKHSQNIMPVDLDSCSGKEEQSNERDCFRKKKKLKSHKNYDSEDYSYSRNGLEEESTLTISEKVIQIHGSSSEEENDSGDEVQRRVFCRSDEVMVHKESNCNRHRIHFKEERKCKKKHRSETHYDSDLVMKKNRHHRTRREEKGKRKLSSSDLEENYSNHYKRPKSRVSSHESSRECRREEKKIKEKNNERNSEHEKRKINREFQEPNGEEPINNHMRKYIKAEPKQERNHKSEPSGSKNSSRTDRRGSKDREVHEWGGSGDKAKPKKPSGEVQKPDFGLSGKLAEDTNTFNGVVIKYSEPPEARMPKKRWRLYPFKGDQGLPTLYIHRQSAYLLGRDRKVVDIPIDHPSCSKQHAALQYRLVSYKRPNGTSGKQIRLYIIDLESANGTFINNNKIDAKKYVELFEKDVIKFGFSSREYVLLHEHSKDDENSEDDS